MSKRFEQINTFGPAKKLKLDVSVNRGRPSTVTSNNIVDFWASDDDDFVLLATQQAENKQQRQTGGIQNTDSEFTFCDFAPQVHGTTSTQQIFAEPMPSSRQPTKLTTDERLRIALPTNFDVEEIFGTDETFVFLPDTHAEKKTAAAAAEELETDRTSKWSDSSFSQATANRRQLAQERQLKFLMERVDVLKKENVKLQKDLVDSNNQAGSRDGEVSLLRNELRQARKLLQASKVEKITLAEEAEKDCNKKVAEVFKKVIAKDAELNFTNVEFSELKIRNAKNNDKNSNKENLNIEESRNLLRMENLCIVSPNEIPLSTKIKSQVYEYNTKEKRAQKKQRTFFEIELEQLLFHYAQLKSQPSTVEPITSSVFMSACRVFTEFWCYAHRLELPLNCMLYPYHHFDLQSDDSISMRHSLIQPGALYNLERAVLLRRYIATLAQICENQSGISKALLEKKHGKCWPIQIVIEAIIKLSYSFELCEHFGVLEATGSLLHSLLSHANAGTASESQLELLCDLLKQLVFTRPSPWVFRELSACMLLCVRQPDFMSKMCINSPSNCFVSDRVRSFYRFGPNSCLIQVYAGLLELCFCGDLPIKPSHFKLLLTICENHVRFVYQCFTAMPEFILRMLQFPSLADDDDKEDSDDKVVNLQADVTPSYNAVALSTINASNMSDYTSIPAQDQLTHERGCECECYVKLCLSVVTLLFQMMYQWLLQDDKSDISQVSEISQIGVHLLTLIFREYYITSLFRDSEETTKHYISLLCNWWKDHALLLSFEDTHLRFLRQLQELQFILKPLHQEANRSNPNNDLVEWTRSVSNADADIPKYIQPDVTNNSKTLFKYNTSDFFNGLKRIAYNFE